MTDTQKFSVEDYKRKIRGLLDKAEATSNEAEQRSFSEAAERLMVKMGIARADLESQGQVKAEDIVEKTRTWTTIYAPAFGDFAYRVGLAFGDLTFLQSRFSKDHVVTYVIGHESDVDQYLVLLESLYLQVWSALKAFRKENRDVRRYYSIHENFVTDRSFVSGYAGTVALRLRSMRREVFADAAPGAALVLASKMDRVKAWKAEQYPELRKGRASRATYSSRGAAAGRAAGQRASLGGNAVGGKGGAISS
jgi:hypothetical protein